jgi:hypothetical protein
LRQISPFYADIEFDCKMRMPDLVPYFHCIQLSPDDIASADPIPPPERETLLFCRGPRVPRRRYTSSSALGRRVDCSYATASCCSATS